MRSRKKQAPPLSGYYIDQKKRYDVAEHEAKPNIYTHKTFKLVFSNDKDDDRFNPADTVFEANDKATDLKETFQRAFKMIQKKITKDNYNSYDYYGQRQKEKEMQRGRELEMEKEWHTSRGHSKSPRRKWKLFNKKSKANPEQVVPDEVPAGDLQIFVNETDEGGFVPDSQPVPFLKAKWKTTKKALEDRLEEIHDRETSAASDACEEVVVDTADATVLPPTSSPGEFNPMWSYILSWIAYERAETSDVPEATSEAVAPLSSSPACNGQKALKRAKAKTLNSKAKNIMSRWNQPASARYDRIGRNLHKEEKFDYPSELEVSDDEAEEAYMFDLRKQLKPYKDDTPVMSLATGHGEGIISNVGKLIKSIRLMQIIFAPIDIIQEKFPSLQTAVILIELVIFVWLLYELSLLIDALCMAVRAVCAPMIAVGKFMNRIM